MVWTFVPLQVNGPRQAANWSAQEMSAGGAKLYAPSKFVGWRDDSQVAGRQGLGPNNPCGR